VLVNVDKEEAINLTLDISETGIEHTKEVKLNLADTRSSIVFAAVELLELLTLVDVFASMFRDEASPFTNCETT
jgi:hypothetical protein